MKYLIPLLFVLSCARPEPGYMNTSAIIGSSVDRYIVTSVDKPKHFSVDLLNIDRSISFSDVGRSKHCNTWEQYAIVGHIVRLKTIIHLDTLTNTEWYEPLNVNDAFCK